MRLYLVRHGEAAAKEVDPRRGLTERGAAQVRRLAAFLQPRRLAVQAIWHSGKTRAAQTALILASAVASARGVGEHDGLDPDDPPEPIVQEIDTLDDDLMIVGHMPFLGRLASRLVIGRESADVIAFATATLACLERDAPGDWAIVAVLRPDFLEPAS